MWEYIFHSPALHIIWLENLFTTVSCWATNLKLNLCNPVQPARSEAPNLAAVGSAEAAGASGEHSDAPSGSSPPPLGRRLERLDPPLGRRLSAPGWSSRPFPFFPQSGATPLSPPQTTLPLSAPLSPPFYAPPFRPCPTQLR